jgi:hypothetical protein
MKRSRLSKSEPKKKRKRMPVVGSMEGRRRLLMKGQIVSVTDFYPPTTIPHRVYVEYPEGKMHLFANFTKESDMKCYVRDLAELKKKLKKELKDIHAKKK